MRARLYYHLTWTTRLRAATVDASIARFLGRYLPAVARQERARVLELGIVRTHVHMLFEANPSTLLPRLVQRLRESLVTGRVAGGRVHDARVAALARSYGIAELWTADRDFGRFPELTARNPLVS